MTGSKRRFCFLQGPHGPFFRELAQALGRVGHSAFRIGFNRSDQEEWRGAKGYRPFRAPIDVWGHEAARLLRDEGATDLVLYGDARPYHAIAVEVARGLGLRTHFFEEGYLRPYWVTYERDGVNGNSRLMQLDLDALGDIPKGSLDVEEIPPARWGEVNAHVAHSLAYHIRNHLWHRAYPNHHRHLASRAVDDWRHVASRVLRQPLLRHRRAARERAVLGDPRPYHLVLLQLGWDSSMQRYSRFASVAEVIETCIAAFVAAAAPDEVLVFKTHPLEDGREGLERRAVELAQAHGLATERLAFIEGGKLAALIAGARSVVTVNSTAAHQALWRDKPVKALGQAVFARPGLVSQKPLADFFADPDPPDALAYQRFRRLLLATSQIRGGFYTAQGRDLALLPAVRAMIRDEDPYEAFMAERRAAAAQAARMATRQRGAQQGAQQGAAAAVGQGAPHGNGHGHGGSDSIAVPGLLAEGEPLILTPVPRRRLKALFRRRARAAEAQAQAQAFARARGQSLERH